MVYIIDRNAIFLCLFCHQTHLIIIGDTMEEVKLEKRPSVAWSTEVCDGHSLCFVAMFV